MASVRLQNIAKVYPPDVKALDNVDLDIGSGEFFTLLGPSGCGKTTLLRTIAGFIAQDRGQISIDGKAIDHVPAYRRDTGMVFQDYAVFPHMSVAANVAFGLRNRKVGKGEIRERVGMALEMARLGGYGSRMPNQLSGGQQQRVGLARAMVIRPQVLLMDEPLSNLDAKLRIELREDIREIQRELGITTIYVTHDQEEALVISDRICIMEAGVVQQVGPPWEIYKQPGTRFVASFVGTMNFIDGWLARSPGNGAAPVVSFEPGQDRAAAREVAVAVRPQDIHAVTSAGGPAPERGLTLEGTVVRITFTGSEAHYLVDCGNGRTVTAHIDRPAREHLDHAGRAIRLAVRPEDLLLFDRQSGQRVALEDR